MRRLSLLVALACGCGGSGSTVTGPAAFSVASTEIIASTTDGGIGGFIAGIADADISKNFTAASVCGGSWRPMVSANTRVVSLALNNTGTALQVGTPYPSSNIYLEAWAPGGGDTQLAGEGATPGTITFTTLTTSQVAGSFSAVLEQEDGGALMIGGTFAATPVVCN